ncbi:MAG TPA: hypothetical protein VGL59_09420 [Polyangia bacterium]
MFGVLHEHHRRDVVDDRVEERVQLLGVGLVGFSIGVTLEDDADAAVRQRDDGPRDDTPAELAVHARGQRTRDARGRDLGVQTTGGSVDRASEVPQWFTDGGGEIHPGDSPGAGIGEHERGRGGILASA